MWRPLIGVGLRCAGLLLAVIPACRAQVSAPPRSPTVAGPYAAEELLLSQAKRRVEAKDYPGAEAVLRNLVQGYPKSADGLYLLALVLERENQPKESLEVYTRAAAARVPGAEELREVALDYVLLDDYPDAVRWLERALSADPKNAEAWYDLGRARMQQGKFIEAAEALRRSLAVRPGDARALDNLGICLEAENRPDEALQAYQKAVKAAEASGHPAEQPFTDEGALLNTRNGFAEAVPLLVRATEIAPRASKGYEELARAYTGLGQTAAARQAMEQAVALDGRNSRLHYQLGRIYKAAGMPAEAQREFQLSAELYGHQSTK